MKALKLIIVSFLSILLCISVVEIVLRLTNYPYNGCEKIMQTEETAFGYFDQDLGWNNIHPESFFSNTTNVWYHFDDNGARVASPGASINYAKPKILFIGGSITFGYGLTNEQTYAHKIGVLLKNKYEIVNLGVQGQGTDQALIMLRRYIEKIKPDYVVYTFIPDHIKRNINYDRRAYFSCIRFHGTKPLFTIKNNRLVLLRSPIPVEKYDKVKTLVLMRRFLDKTREHVWETSGLDRKITENLIEEINNTAKGNKARILYIYYDTWRDDNIKGAHKKQIEELFLDKNKKVYGFYNFVTDPSVEYFVPSSSYHPSDYTTTLIAEGFVDAFKEEFDSLRQ